MPTTVEIYQEKYRAFQDAEGLLTEATHAILHVASRISTAKGKCYAKGLDPIPRILEERGTKVDFTNWPSKDQFNVLTVAYYDALRETIQAWEALKPEERIGLQPPPKED